MNRLTKDEERSGADAPQREIRRAFLLMSVPFALFIAGLVYIVWFGDTANDLRGVAAEERRLGVVYAIEHTRPADVPNLWAAIERSPAEWDRRTVDAVVDLVKRSAWPDPLDPNITTSDLLAVAPTQWSAPQLESVAELLRRFESAHPKRY